MNENGFNPIVIATALIIAIKPHIALIAIATIAIAGLATIL
jgi:hypothetical protein